MLKMGAETGGEGRRAIQEHPELTLRTSVGYLLKLPYAPPLPKR
jgi:hypothetical protein